MQKEGRGKKKEDKLHMITLEKQRGRSSQLGQKENTYMRGMISLNDWTMIMKCIYNS